MTDEKQQNAARDKRPRQTQAGWAQTNNVYFNTAKSCIKVLYVNEPEAEDTPSSWEEGLEWGTYSKNEHRSHLW